MADSFSNQSAKSQRARIEHVATSSGDILEIQLANLRKLFPDVFVEGKVDFDKLRATLGASAESGPGRFHFGWAGKDDAVALLQTPSRGTLVPYPEESTDFEKTGNVFIEGENLEVLKLLFKPYFGRVKLIYIDPPYNTGQDFIYPDNYADPLKTYLEMTGQADSEGNLLTTNPETSGRYHSAWLSMMYPRLFLARQLLTDDGVIAVSIDDHEMHHLRVVMNEVFGEENFIATIVVQANKRGQTFKDISKTHEYLLLYSHGESPDLAELKKAGDALPYEDSKGQFDLWELRNRNPKFGRHNRPNLFFPIYVCSQDMDEAGLAKISLAKSVGCSIEVFPRNSEGEDGCWRWSAEKIRKSDLTSSTATLVARKRKDGGWNIYERSRKSTTKPKSIWDETAVISEQGTIELGALGLGGVFDHPKPVGLIKKVLEITTREEDIVVDFFAGACTTAEAVMELNREDGGNRRFILVQLPDPTSNQKFPTNQLPEEFVNLWDRIKYKTRYQVLVNTERLVKDVVNLLDKIKIAPPRIIAGTAAVVADAKEDRLDYEHLGKGIVATLKSDRGLPNIVAMIEDLISHVNPPIKLTRKTLAAIVTQSKNRQAALDNPQEFAFQSARIIREKAIEHLVDGIQYSKDGTWYDMTEWVEEEETTSDRIIAVDNSIYDHIVVQSETERKFVEKLKKRKKEVKFFVKLPAWFKVRTPVGQYNPDWGLVMKLIDAFGDEGPILYLIRETKSTTVTSDLRGTENQKNHCGERHFVGALGVDYRVITSADDLP